VSDYQNIAVSIEEKIALITMNRPRVLNAINMDTLRELYSAIHHVNGLDGTKVVILTGAGDKAFAAGADIKDLVNWDVFEALQFAQLGCQVMEALENMEKPVIAAINGLAVGGGCEIAIACDIIIASEKAVFGLPEVNLGTIQAFGGTQRLPRLVGKTQAKELIFTGEPIDAKRAYEIGLVNRICPHGQVLEEAKKMAATIASKGATAIQLAKKAINEGYDLDQARGCNLEQKSFALSFASQDRMEGVKAFLEKRKPVFKD
jgi:enoyl-CoA hydratase